ncbi:YfiT family bacillithiol transferase [Foetidibacter luteolus]|uniref:YfiT family bacillithiol transferase n=1 Tax=Foetidibacter luteolus TaxID=2608880 RepID=UPI00129B65D4|nr:putative metal-dependent hydrolase [Foetidibacter luteolus]
MSDDLRYPIGKFTPLPFSHEQKEKWLLDIKFLPDDMEHAVLNLDAQQLDTPYREGGWKVTQLVHHVADSHMNAYIRFRLGLTEQNPVIKPYEEGEWAKLQDSELIPINVSLTLLHCLHQRLYACIKDLTVTQWERTVFHPEHKKQISLWELLGMYAWHGRHHVKHITALRERRGW